MTLSVSWSMWVIGLVVLNLGIALFLYLWGPRARVPTQPDGTSGHVWAHGLLRERVRDLPRWWIVLSGSMFVVSFVYLLLYPGYGSFAGVLGWTSHGELARHVATNGTRLDALLQRCARIPVEQLARDPAARQLGARLFGDDCAACHGRAGRGNPRLGAPDLTDRDWLYGGTGAAITASIHDGRNGVMPPWASLGKENVEALTQYVLSLSGAAHDERRAAAGRPLFATCAACHGADGKGNQTIGAPDLTDHVWLHGGSVADIEETIGHGRQGHMPAWSARLTDAEIHVLAGYVHGLSHRGGADGTHSATGRARVGLAPPAGGLARRGNPARGDRGLRLDDRARGPHGRPAPGHRPHGARRASVAGAGRARAPVTGVTRLARRS